MGVLDKIKKTLKSEDSAKREDTAGEKEFIAESKGKNSGKKTGGVSSALFYRIIIDPRITEKSSMLQTHNQYVFHVDQRTRKSEVKKAIEDIFNVHVERVNTINVSGKKVRLGKHEGRSNNFKKAIVTLKEGDKIEVGV